MALITNIIDIVLHLDKHLNTIIQNFGSWSYLLFFFIIFAETGFVVTPFLPGDSLLFALGTFTALGAFDLFWIFIVLTSAAILGDNLNYAIGRFVGQKAFEFNSKLFKKEYLDKTHRFYEKYGKKTIIIAQFVPIVRTFAPFVAGIGKMDYRYFIVFNVIGVLLWVSIFVFGGYFFGNMPVIKNNFSLVVLGVILISVSPILIELWKHHRAKKRTREAI